MSNEQPRPSLASYLLDAMDQATSASTHHPSSTPPSAESARLQAPIPLSSKLLDAGAAVLQSHAPPRQLSLHLISLPCYTHSLHHQRLTHHYCHRLSEDVWQCCMWDGSDATSRLIGVEYVVGEKTFATIPEEEKKMWHSHHQEIRGGNTLAPGLPEVAERQVMQELANTYGKGTPSPPPHTLLPTTPSQPPHPVPPTPRHVPLDRVSLTSSPPLPPSVCLCCVCVAIHFWAAQDPLPYGPPKLIVTMCTPDIQAQYGERAVWQDKDDSTGTSSAGKAERRTDLEYHDRMQGSDQWERGGEAYEFVAVPVSRSEEVVRTMGGIRNQYRDVDDVKGSDDAKAGRQ